MYSIHEADIHSTPHMTAEADVLHGDLHKDEWRAPRTLDAPPARDGYTQRWVRFDTHEGPDNRNSQNKSREGWTPRTLESVPEEYRHFPTINRGSLGDVIFADGMVLCEMTIQRAAERNENVQRVNRRQQAAVNDEIDQVNTGAGHGFGRITRSEQRTRTVGSRQMVIQDD
jgi:hypothetical protein